MNNLYNKGWLTIKPPYLDEKELDKNLGSGNFIFIGSSCDMWAENIPSEWIEAVLKQVKKYPCNKYLFQSKNPRRFSEFDIDLPDHCITGTTIETNRTYICMGITPPPNERAIAMDGRYGFITIEPILDFDIYLFVAMIKNANPDYVNIGADSGNNHLPEPEPEKIKELISELETFTEVHLKKNLKRLLPELA
jgi:protein gp37